MLKQVVIERDGEKFVVEVCAQLNHRFCAVVDYVHDWLSNENPNAVDDRINQLQW